MRSSSERSERNACPGSASPTETAGMADIRLYVDEHIPRAVVRGLRSRGVDVATVTDAGLRQADDTEHLAWALKEDRVIVSYDPDFLRLHAQGVPHAGIAHLPRQLPIGMLVRSLLLLHDPVAAEDMQGHMEFL